MTRRDAVCDLYVHLSWHTWRRVACLDPAAVRDLVAAIDDAGERCGVTVLRGACLRSRVDLLVRFQPTTRLSDFVGFVKSLSCWHANQRKDGALRWSRGFSARSVANGELESVHFN
ncbi:MAG: transposase [Gemmatimonadetes bacterium]|nr:transposase [Gemmatimonadota bacterium]